jgi:hypothetical protein
MAKVCVDSANDVLSGKRRLLWDEKIQDFAIEGFEGETRLQYDANGKPVLVGQNGYPMHASGQVGIAPLAILGIGALAVIQGVGIYLLVDQGLKTLQVITEQKTQRTLAEAAKKQ